MGKCPRNCVSKKKYDKLLVENIVLKQKIKQLESGKIKFENSDSSGSSGFDTANDSPITPFSDEFVSPIRYRSRNEKARGGNKKSKKSKKSKGKTVKRMRG
tara:strand:+ start:62 stop:364 length:303 start_codon:yes stop_codon:yes gene_type:complete